VRQIDAPVLSCICDSSKGSKRDSVMLDLRKEAVYGTDLKENNPLEDGS
jgi:hypothetical protein